MYIMDICMLHICASMARCCSIFHPISWAAKTGKSPLGRDWYRSRLFKILMCTRHVPSWVTTFVPLPIYYFLHLFPRSPSSEAATAVDSFFFLPSLPPCVYASWLTSKAATTLKELVCPAANIIGLSFLKRVCPLFKIPSYRTFIFRRLLLFSEVVCQDKHVWRLIVYNKCVTKNVGALKRKKLYLVDVAGSKSVKLPMGLLVSLSVYV